MKRCAVLVVAVLTATIPTAVAQVPATWYVQAGAAPGGDGSPEAPFDGLDDAAAASGAGDTIIVLPAPASQPPLDTGIALKKRQRLIGGGPPVKSLGAGDDAPRIANAAGDAVLLADGAEVSNIVVTSAFRGGIYGLDVTDVIVRGNDVSGFNTSCTTGFQILPIVAPTNVPGVGVPFGFSVPILGTRKFVLDINNGWAGIMIDASHASGSVRIEDNLVHDSDCGDGIDVRLSGTASLIAEVHDNVVTQLRQGEFEAEPGSIGVDAINAMGFQSDDSSRLLINASGNVTTYIGSEGSDCEGIFASLARSSTLIARIDRHYFAHGIGGSSCNGMEMISGDGNPYADMRISNSIFEDDPGDMMEAGNLGVGSIMHLELDNVVVRNTTIRGGNDGAIPFNIGECLLAGNSGSGNVLSVRIRRSELTGCNNGVSVGSALALGNGVGPDGSVTLEIMDSAIHGNAFHNVFVQNGSAMLRELDVRMSGNDLTGAGEDGVKLVQRPSAVTLLPAIDLGGGALGSEGGNCLFGNGSYDVDVSGFTVSARSNWWGDAAGPGSIAASPPVVSSVDATSWLSGPPPACAG